MTLDVNGSRYVIRRADRCKQNRAQKQQIQGLIEFVLNKIEDVYMNFLTYNQVWMQGR